MIHGLGGQSTNWTDLMSELTDDLAGWAPDLPGFGWSPPPPDRRRLEKSTSPMRGCMVKPA